MTEDHAQFDALLECDAPLLIGVRHHSAALSRAIPALLDAFQPECVLIELPMEFAEWLPWLGHEETTAPVALAGCATNAFGLCFYPFADFSPELAAVRWALRNNVPVKPCDLPIAGHRGEEREHTATNSEGLLERLFQKTQTRDVGMLWERLVETPAVGSTPEAIRRSGLLFGYALRRNDGTASAYDRRRESHMRECIADETGRLAVVVGAYHAPALLPEPMLWSEPDPPETDAEAAEITTALIPYSFGQLDERSGYPAGIRDPIWHQRAWSAASAEELDAATAELTVSVCRALRTAKHPINVADGKEVLRMTRDLTRLRGWRAPGRGEFIEAVQTCLTRGELLGIGRAVAAAMEEILVGNRFGSLPVDLPRSGLAPHVESLFEDLKLPGPRQIGEQKRLRLDPLRNRLDRARVVTFERLIACGVPYAKREAGEDLAHRENLTDVWQIEWQSATAAMIELSAARGATLAQAAFGALQTAGLGKPLEEWSTAELPLLIQAARCGLVQPVDVGLRWLVGPFLLTAGLSELTQAMELIEQVRAGHHPGLPSHSEHDWPHIVQKFELSDDIQTAPLLQAAIARVEGISGSEDIRDVTGLLDLILWFQQQPSDQNSVAAGRLIWTLRKLASDGSALMQGAATGALLLLEQFTSEVMGQKLGGWIDAAVDAESRRALQDRLRGCVTISLPRMTADVSCLDDAERRLAAESDQEFLSKLPALRGGFHIISPASRDRLLKVLLERLPDEQTTAVDVTIDPETTALRFAADEAGLAAVHELMPEWSPNTDWQLPDASESQRPTTKPGQQLSVADRWRLVLGSRPEQLPPMGCAAARALDELYGHGCGEGSAGRIGGGGAGQEAPYPNVRTWADDLGELFGESVREDVLAAALADGRSAVLSILDTETVTPSIELLEQVLSLKGAVPEAQLETLRRLARRITDQLVKELATRLRPALFGLSTSRPTYRRTRRLDLDRTLRANLHRARRSPDGRTTIVPERLIFRSRSQRSMDWHVVFVVDVSGSMEPSVIYSAMMAAIFSGLPAISVTFLAFSTKVIDLTERVDDPLAMLMEVQVGGGTHIAKGLRAARERLTLPTRSLVLLVSDFEEGWPVSGLLGEVRALVDSGTKCLGLAALNDDGKPRYNKGIAGQVAGCGMPVSALSPLELARWVGEQIR